MRILSISSPGGDRGPAVGYRNHLKALSISELADTTRDVAKLRHSHEYYRNKTIEVIQEIQR